MQPLVVATRLALGLAAIGCVLLSPSIAKARDTSEVLLELVPAAGPRIELTRVELEALPQVDFETTTTWTEEPARYSGPRLSEVLALAGLSGVAVDAEAGNDYSVTLTPDLIGPDYPIIALRIDGKPFGPRELGPLWIVYPYDSDPQYRSERVFAASVWNLISLAPSKE